MTAYDRSMPLREFQAPVVAGVQITTDAQGRFNLNALHKASGAGPSKAPAQWLRLDQAKELTAELEGQTGSSRPGETVRKCIVSTMGRNGGTFAAEELAVSYAGWISPSFQLEVNRTFIAYRKGELRPLTSTPAVSSPAATREARQLMKMFLALGKEMKLDPNQRILSANQGVKKLTGVDMMGSMGVQQIEAPHQAPHLNPSDIGMRLGGRKAHVINLLLTAEGFQTQHRDAKGNVYYQPTDKGIAAGGVMTDTTKQQGGTPIRQLRWTATIIDHLRPFLEGRPV
ncbi:KilA-N domain-containing protein [Paracoccus yeei]|uniref:KilA-N domain-containing protein n=1 Tax=Paracoccus yeei TaxID=147645 RepID=A0A2D2C539_9RHOB|nr:KilA-N domain-containing protein [Paracoccus yeei]ATQ57630.1 hypothetical protein PYTT13_10590 [Paracoccus yeei]